MPKNCSVHIENHCSITGGACIGEEYCSYPVEEKIETCDICGNRFLKEFAIYDLDTYQVICRSCSDRSGTCFRCTFGTECTFETDPSSLPKIVMVETRQENMVIRQQMKNPDRIRQTCQNGCNCWSEEFGCCKENFQTCGNYMRVK